MVVDLAVEYDRELPVPAPHRLMPRFREIDDRQSSVAQGEPAFTMPELDPAFVIRATMFDAVEMPARGLRPE